MQAKLAQYLLESDVILFFVVRMMIEKNCNKEVQQEKEKIWLKVRSEKNSLSG